MRSWTFLFVIFFLLSIECYGKEVKKIPEKPDKLFFRYERFVTDSNRTEFFIYSIVNNMPFGMVELREDGKKVVRKKKEMLKFPDNRKYFINYLNFLNYPELDDKILNDPKKTQYHTLIKLSLRYQYKGKVVEKNIIVKDIDILIEENRCKEAFQVQQLLLLIDSFQYMVFKYGTEVDAP